MRASIILIYLWEVINLPDNQSYTVVNYKHVPWYNKRLRLLCNHKNIFSVVGKSFVELVRYLFSLPDVKSFLSQRICQDPLERFFGCQRQRGGVHDNPNVQEFVKNTQALQVINSIVKAPTKGNCRGSHQDNHDKENTLEPLSKRPRRSTATVKPLGLS